MGVIEPAWVVNDELRRVELRQFYGRETRSHVILATISFSEMDRYPDDVRLWVESCGFPPIPESVFLDRPTAPDVYYRAGVRTGQALAVVGMVTSVALLVWLSYWWLGWWVG